MRIQRQNSSLEVELETGSWTKEMRTVRSTINGGKRRIRTSKAIVVKDNRKTMPQEDARSGSEKGFNTTDLVYGAWE